jgi:predicted nuclease of predicted toxin-antitoxin system
VRRPIRSLPGRDEVSCRYGRSTETARRLREHGHDALHLRDEGLHRLPDPEILKKAAGERRIVLTFDLDFGDLLALSLDRSPSVAIFRLHDQRPATVTARLLALIRDRRPDLEAGVLVIVEDARFRLHRLPIGQ